MFRFVLTPQIESDEILLFGVTKFVRVVAKWHGMLILLFSYKCDVVLNLQTSVCLFLVIYIKFALL